MKDCKKCWDTSQTIEELREYVWMMDIPHPTVPEYVELHERIQKILKFIDDRLLKEGMGNE